VNGTSSFGRESRILHRIYANQAIPPNTMMDRIYIAMRAPWLPPATATAADVGGIEGNEIEGEREGRVVEGSKDGNELEGEREGKCEGNTVDGESEGKTVGMPPEGERDGSNVG